MDKDFNYWKRKSENQDLFEFNFDRTGQLWLKVKSIIRKELIDEFVQFFSISLMSSSLKDKFPELYDILVKDAEKSHEMLNKYIEDKNRLILQSLDTTNLVSELYKLKNFEWGGDYKNSLDKYLISHYVKVIKSYNELLSKFDIEINGAVKGYVLNSWYNHWSSILIEHLFKSHDAVLPTVGQIKGVDFFINDIPFDLKVTYFPSEYLKLKRKEKGFPIELTYLKTKAKELAISYDSKASASEIYYEITEKLKDRNDSKSVSVMQKLKEENLSILEEAKSNPKLLIKWLYENQGEMRFGSENRLFLVLVDTDDFSNSWKLKRSIELLQPPINAFLNSIDKKDRSDLEVRFRYPGKAQEFMALADVIFVLK